MIQTNLDKQLTLVTNLKSKWEELSNIYTKAHFEKRLDHYVWIKELGNSSRKLPPTLVDEAEGMAKLKELCFGTNRIVLLCAEKDEKRCHRSYVKNRIVDILENHD